MLTHPSNPSFPRLRGAVGGFARLLGGWALGEPAMLLPKRNADRLAKVEWMERLRQAERDGDQATLDEAMVQVQLSEADLSRLSARATPLAEWPDEDVDSMIGVSSERPVNRTA